MEGRLQTEPLFDDRHQHVDRHGDPYLRLHRILRGSVEPLDPKVLFNPLEKELNLPAFFIQGGHGERGKFEVVGQKHQRLAGLGVVVADAAKLSG